MQFSIIQRINIIAPELLFGLMKKFSILYFLYLLIFLLEINCSIEENNDFSTILRQMWNPDLPFNLPEYNQETKQQELAEFDNFPSSYVNFDDENFSNIISDLNQSSEFIQSDMLQSTESSNDHDKLLVLNQTDPPTKPINSDFSKFSKSYVNQEFSNSNISHNISSVPLLVISATDLVNSTQSTQKVIFQGNKNFLNGSRKICILEEKPSYKSKEIVHILASYLKIKFQIFSPNFFDNQNWANFRDSFSNKSVKSRFTKIGNISFNSLSQNLHNIAIHSLLAANIYYRSINIKRRDFHRANRNVIELINQEIAKWNTKNDEKMFIFFNDFELQLNFCINNEKIYLEKHSALRLHQCITGNHNVKWKLKNTIELHSGIKFLQYDEIFNCYDIMSPQIEGSNFA